MFQTYTFIALLPFCSIPSQPWSCRAIIQYFGSMRSLPFSISSDLNLNLKISYSLSSLSFWLIVSASGYTAHFVQHFLLLPTSAHYLFNRQCFCWISDTFNKQNDVGFSLIAPLSLSILSICFFFFFQFRGAYCAGCCLFSMNFFMWSELHCGVKTLWFDIFLFCLSFMFCVVPTTLWYHLRNLFCIVLFLK